MIKNYFKISFRNITRHKLFSFINFSGLSIGLACFAIIMKFIYFEMNYFLWNWLTEFAYRIEISIWMFLDAFLVGISIALVAVSFRAIKAATANPVKSLR